MRVLTRESKSVFLIIEASFVSLIIVFSIISPQIAGATIYQPGETLEPDCAPGALNCGVTVTTSSLGTGTTIANSLLTIQATSTNSILATLRAFAGQVSNLFQVQDSSGSNLFRIDSLGEAFFSNNVNVGGTFGVTGSTTLTGALTLADTLTTSENGIEFTESDTNPDCIAGDYTIYSDLSEGKLKKCQNGVVSDLDMTGSDVQSAASYDTSEALTNITASQAILTSVSVTPSTVTGDIYVRAKAEILSGNSTNQSLILSIEDDATCTGSTLVTKTITITSNSGSVIGDFEVVAIDVDVGTSSRAYSFCASTATGDSDIRLFEMFATVIDTGADVAEIYTTHDESLEAGDVVSLDPSLQAGVKKSENVDDRSVIGIVSTRPGTVIGGVSKEGAKAVPIALSGRTPVKVIIENGVIEPGDYLVPSSQPGVAMKARGAGSVIGQALSVYDREDAGIITAFVKNFELGESALNSEETSPEYIDTIQVETARDPIAIIRDKISSGARFFADFVVGRITAIRGYFDEIFAKKVHTEQMCFQKSDGSEVCMSGDQVDALLKNVGAAPSPSLPVQSFPVIEQTPALFDDSTPTSTDNSDLASSSAPVLEPTPPGE